MPRTLRRRRRGLTRLGVVLGLILLLLGGGFLWFKDSELVAVEKVTVEGVSGENAKRIERALVAEANGMTTLSVDQQALADAVAEFPNVKAVRAAADFPDGLRVTVTERDPVGAVAVAGRRTPVAPDGTLLTRDTAGGRLPRVDPEASASGGRVTTAKARRVIDLLAAAPKLLRARIRRAGYGSTAQGLRATFRAGPAVIFGDKARLTAKWAAATRILAEDSARGAKYIDVRVPERPAAGGLPTEQVAPFAGVTPVPSTSTAP